MQDGTTGVTSQSRGIMPAVGVKNICRVCRSNFDGMWRGGANIFVHVYRMAFPGQSYTFRCFCGLQRLAAPKEWTGPTASVSVTTWVNQ